MDFIISGMILDSYNLILEDMRYGNSKRNQKR